MRIGVLGGGQLGQMLALAGLPLGLSFVFLDPIADSPAGQVARLLCAEFDDPKGLDQLAASVDLLTFDFENVPVESMARLAHQRPVYPAPAALAIAQDRLEEKTCFRRLGLATAPFMAVNSLAELTAAVNSIGLPAILKTRRWGYDGKGQARLLTQADIATAWGQLGGQALILEGFVAFECEVSLIAVRSTTGETAFYPLVENTHQDGILRSSRAPYLNTNLQTQAENQLRCLLTDLDYVGVLTVEFFVKNGRLIANEMAPRVHNSGHWTIEGAVTSQFENHLRAILGLPLGRTDAIGHSVMINCIGELPTLAEVAAVSGAHAHFYGKEARPGRKLGHITVTAADPQALQAAVDKLSANL